MFSYDDDDDKDDDDDDEKMAKKMMLMMPKMTKKVEKGHLAKLLPICSASSGVSRIIRRSPT